VHSLKSVLESRLHLITLIYKVVHKLVEVRLLLLDLIIKLKFLRPLEVSFILIFNVD
jgi:hypothetical protein